jgi:tetratricopeptide (TPR) repeat protein
MKDIDNHKLIKFKKRPVSITFLAIYSSSYFVTILITLTGVKGFIDFIYGFLIITSFFGIPLFIVLIILLFINLRKNKIRTRGFIISSAICLLIVPLAFLSASFFKAGLERADSYMLKKNYETAIKYYDDVIENEKDAGIKDIAMSDKIKAQKFIDDAKRQKEAGDIFYSYELYNRAEEKYKKAYAIYPYLGGIKKSIDLAVSMKEKTNNFTGKANYILFSDKLKFSYTSGLPIKWGNVKVSSPFLAEFQNISFQKGKFFESENELKISGTIYGKPEIADFIESEKGLFVFISAVIINDAGEIKWEKDGYIKGDTPYLKEGENKDFSLISTIINPIETEDRLIIIAYVKRNVIILTDTENPYNPDALRNVFSFYTIKGIKI